MFWAPSYGVIVGYPSGELLKELPEGFEAMKQLSDEFEKKPFVDIKVVYEADCSEFPDYEDMFKRELILNVWQET